MFGEGGAKKEIKEVVVAVAVDCGGRHDRGVHRFAKAFPKASVGPQTMAHALPDNLMDDLV